MKFDEVLEVIIKSISTIDLGSIYYNIYFVDGDVLDVRIEHKQSVDGDFSILGSLFDNVDFKDKSKIKEIIVDALEEEDLDGVINLHDEISTAGFKHLVLDELNVEKIFETEKGAYDYYVLIFDETKVYGGKDGKHEFIRRYSHVDLNLIQLMIALKDDFTITGLQAVVNNTQALRMKFVEGIEQFSPYE